MLTLHTTIETSYKTKLLLRGTLVASLGLVSMIAASVECGPTILQQGGIFVFLFGFAAITYGLLPYRKLLRLELFPNHLFVGDRAMEYVSGKKIEKISFEEIASLQFYEKRFGLGYGILIAKKNGSIKMLPFFSKRSFERLTRYL